MSVISYESQEEVRDVSLANADCVSLDGKPVLAGNQVDGNLVKVFTAPVLLLFRSPVKLVRGTVLLFPGGAYSILEMQKEGENTVRFLNQQGFDVALLEYHIASGLRTRELALADALTAFRLLKANARALGIRDGSWGIMGYSAGGHLAARTVQNLATNEQPDNLILVYPAYLEETLSESVASRVEPPLSPNRLFVLASSNDNSQWVGSSQQYSEKWRKHGGLAHFHLLADAGHGFGMEAECAASTQQWPELLKFFLLSGSSAATTSSNYTNPATQ